MLRFWAGAESLGRRPGPARAPVDDRTSNEARIDVKKQRLRRDDIKGFSKVGGVVLRHPR